MMRLRTLLLLLAMAPAPAAAAGIVADLSSPFVAVTTGFTGADLIVFGSMDQPADVAVVVEGPIGEAAVRRKSRFLGIWLNTGSFVFDQVPGYYAVATSGPLSAPEAPDIAGVKSLNLAKLAFPARKGEAAEIDSFRLALLQNQQTQKLYSETPQGVRILSERLFRTTFHLPAYAPIGAYTVHVYLLSGDRMLATQTLPLVVGETGLSAAIYEMARTAPFLYAGIALLMALIMGGGGAILFHRMT